MVFQASAVARMAFRASRVARGGGGDPHPPYPKVWSPTGSWYCDPPNWKRNTAIAFVVWFGITGITFMKSAELEVRHMNPTHPIPSARWAKVPPVKVID